MATLENLRNQGWHISAEGLNKLSENERVADLRNITRKALDIDLRDIGAPVIATEITKNTFGPAVLQIVKLKNISAPKSKQNSQAAPRMLKLVLTDGHTNCQGIEIKPISSLSLDKTIPGTKILIDGAQILSSAILLTPEYCKILGGVVSVLVEKWELSKLMPSHIRVNEDGPPAWVNFGKKVVNSLTNNQGFKSLENKNKENTKENAEFQVQRQDAILEATQGAVKKVFGGGVKPAQTFNSTSSAGDTNHYNSQPRAPRPVKNKKEKVELEKLEKPSQRVSLFDFLEDKLPISSDTKKITNEIKKYDNPPSSRKYENSTKFNKPTQNNYKQDDIKKPYQSDTRYQNNYRQDSDSKTKYQNNYRQDVDTKKPYQSETRYQNNYRQDRFQENDKSKFNNSRPDEVKKTQSDARYQNDRNFRQDLEKKPETRYQNDRPPRFQKQRPIPNQPEPRSKPNTHNFVDKITHEMNNISLYNSKYETEKLHKPPPAKLVEETNGTSTWKWKIGDRCMAKYWEDNKYYNALVTGITTRTCMVEFLEYGNFEEVLHVDCIPIMPENPERQSVPKTYNKDTQQFSGSLEFRRGNNRPFVRTPNKPQHPHRNYES